MKFFLLVVGMLLVSGGLVAGAVIAFSQVDKAKSAAGRVAYRTLSLASAVLAVLFVLWVIKTQTAQPAVQQANPIDALNARAAQKAAEIERPVLESKTHREYVRGATSN